VNESFFNRDKIFREVAMKTFLQIGNASFVRRCALTVWFAAGVLLVPSSSKAGTWTALNDPAPGPVQLIMLCSDGTVMAFRGSGTSWYRLTPDSNGSYINGSWTTRDSMSFTRRFHTSTVLRDGRVFIAGAEYGTGWGNAEIYNPVTDNWSMAAAVPPGLILTNNNPQPPNNNNTAGFVDSMGKILPNGNVLISPVRPATARGTVIYNPVANSWSAGPASLRSQGEAGWTKLPDDSFLTVDSGSTQSERYIPSLNTWINDDTVPVSLYGVGTEIGASLLLPDGRAWFIGGNNNTAFYTPSGSTNQGSWATGPDLPNSQACPDAPAAMLVNGNVLVVCGPLGVSGNAFPTNGVSYYEYNPVSNVFTRQNAPGGGLTTPNMATYNACLCCLPDGNVLYSDESSQLYVYTPTGSPIAAGKPTISNISWKTGGKLRLTGTKLNGISEGAAYGDDMQMDSNYPLIRLTSGGNVYYARTFNWSSTSVSTGSELISTDFTLPSSIYQNGGSYSLRVVVNGIASDAVTFYGPTWVDFNYGGIFEFGYYSLPYNTLSEGINNVPTGGTVAIKAGTSPTKTFTITKAMLLIAPDGGSAVIGD
jgi:hypothetical protein